MPRHGLCDLHGQGAAALFGRLAGDLAKALDLFKMAHGAFHLHGHEAGDAQLGELLGKQLQFVRLGHALIDGETQTRLVGGQRFQQLHRAFFFETRAEAPARAVEGDDLVAGAQAQHFGRVAGVLRGKAAALYVKGVHGRRAAMAVHSPSSRISKFS